MKTPAHSVLLTLARVSALMIACALLFAGCATNTVESRRHERLGGYNALTAEQRLAVDAGQIKVGMSEDAVYIAWGRPSQVIAGERAAGPVTTWLYFGTYFEEMRSWDMGHGRYCGRWYGGPYISYHYAPRNYVRAEVRFESGVVKEWHRLPAR